MRKGTKPQEPPRVFLTPEEAQAIQMALGMLMENFEITKDQSIPFNPLARGYIMGIISAANSAAAKIEKITGITSQIPEYNEGDEDEFLTKES